MTDWFALTFPLVFIGMWLVVLKILSAVGGWARLAASYPADRRPDGARFVMKSAKLGAVNYNGCLQFVASPDGLFIAVLLPWLPSHPPMFVPWSDISVVPCKVLWFRCTELVFKRRPELRMRMAEKLGTQLLAERARVNRPDAA